MCSSYDQQSSLRNSELRNLRVLVSQFSTSIEPFHPQLQPQLQPQSSPVEPLSSPHSSPAPIVIDVAALEQSISHLKDEIVEEKSLRFGIEQNMTMLAGEYEEEKRRFGKELRILQEANDTLQKTLDRIRAELSASSANVAQLEEGLQELDTQLTEKSQFERMVRNVTAALSSRLELPLDQSFSIVELFGRLESQIHERDLKLVDQQETIKKLESSPIQPSQPLPSFDLSKSDILRDRTRELQKDFGVLKSEAQQLQEMVLGSIHNFQKEMGTAKHLVTRQLTLNQSADAEMMIENRALSQSIFELERKNASLQENLDLLEGRLSESTNAVSERTQALCRLEEDHAELKEENSQLEDALEELGAELEVLRVEKNLSQDALESSRLDALRQQQSTIQVIKKENDSLLSELRGYTQLQEQQRKLNSDYEDSIKKLSGVNKENEQQEETIRSLRKQVGEQQLEMDGLGGQLQQMKETSLSDLLNQGKLGETIEKLQEQISSLNQTIHAQDQGAQELSQENLVLRNSFGLTTHRLNEFKKKVAEFERRNEEERKNRLELEKNIIDLTVKNIHLTLALDHNLVSLDSAESSLSSLQEKVGILQKEKAQTEPRLKNLLDEKKKLKKELFSLQSQTTSTQPRSPTEVFKSSSTTPFVARFDECLPNIVECEIVRSDVDQAKVIPQKRDWKHSPPSSFSETDESLSHQIEELNRQTEHMGLTITKEEAEIVLNELVSNLDMEDLVQYSQWQQCGSSDVISDDRLCQLLQVEFLVDFLSLNQPTLTVTELPLPNLSNGREIPLQNPETEFYSDTGDSLVIEDVTEGDVSELENEVVIEEVEESDEKSEGRVEEIVASDVSSLRSSVSEEESDHFPETQTADSVDHLSTSDEQEIEIDSPPRDLSQLEINSSHVDDEVETSPVRESEFSTTSESEFEANEPVLPMSNLVAESESIQPVGVLIDQEDNQIEIGEDEKRDFEEESLDSLSSSETLVALPDSGMVRDEEEEMSFEESLLKERLIEHLDSVSLGELERFCVPSERTIDNLAGMPDSLRLRRDQFDLLVDSVPNPLFDNLPEFVAPSPGKEDKSPLMSHAEFLQESSKISVDDLEKLCLQREKDPRKMDDEELLKHSYFADLLDRMPDISDLIGNVDDLSFSSSEEEHIQSCEPQPLTGAITSQSETPSKEVLSQEVLQPIVDHLPEEETPKESPVKDDLMEENLQEDLFSQSPTKEEGAHFSPRHSAEKEVLIEEISNEDLPSENPSEEESCRDSPPPPEVDIDVDVDTQTPPLVDKDDVELFLDDGSLQPLEVEKSAQLTPISRPTLNLDEFVQESSKISVDDLEKLCLQRRKDPREMSDEEILKHSYFDDLLDRMPDISSLIGDVNVFPIPSEEEDQTSIADPVMEEIVLEEVPPESPTAELIFADSPPQTPTTTELNTPENEIDEEGDVESDFEILEVEKEFELPPISEKSPPPIEDIDVTDGDNIQPYSEEEYSRRISALSIEELEIAAQLWRGFDPRELDDDLLLDYLRLQDLVSRMPPSLSSLPMNQLDDVVSSPVISSPVISSPEEIISNELPSDFFQDELPTESEDSPLGPAAFERAISSYSLEELEELCSLKGPPLSSLSDEQLLRRYLFDDLVSRMPEMELPSFSPSDDDLAMDSSSDSPPR